MAKKIALLVIILILMGFTAYCFYPKDNLASNVQTNSGTVTIIDSIVILADDVQIDSVVTIPKGTVIDSITVYKSKRRMMVYSKGELLKTYRISLGGEPVGAKEFEGDLKTPEGLYFIDGKNPNSRYHKNMNVSYPNKKDIEYAKSLGKSAGGDIKIHGIGKYIDPAYHLFDWTLGCIAVTDAEIDELYSTVKMGAKIEIKP